MSLLSFAFLLLFCFREKEDFGSGKVWSQETVFRNGLHKQQRQQAAKNLDSNLWPKICIQKHMLTEDEIQTYKALFQEFHDVFAWSYEEMPGIDPAIVVHEIKTYPDAKPV